MTNDLERKQFQDGKAKKEKPLSDDEIIKKFYNKYTKIGWKTIEEIVKETREQTTAKNKPNQHETDLAIIARLTAENDTLKSMRKFWINENKKLENRLKESEQKTAGLLEEIENNRVCKKETDYFYLPLSFWQKLKEKYGVKDG